MKESRVDVLLREASSGSPVAVDELLESYLPGLRAFVRLRLGRRLGAKESHSDLVQSTCREVIEKLDRYQYGGEQGFKRWLYATALRKIGQRLEYYRAAKRDVALERPLEPGDSAAGEALLGVYASFCTPSRQAVVHEEIDRIEQAIAELPEDYREVIVQARLLGMSHAEIGAHMKRSEGAARALLFRALAHLAEIMHRGGDPASPRDAAGPHQL